MIAKSGRQTRGRKFGRMSLSERDALKTILPLVRISPEHTLNKAELFGREQPLYLEIGFGNGEFLHEKALSTPHCDFIGIEIYVTGIAKLLRKIVSIENPLEISTTNIRVFNEDARDILQNNVPPDYLDGAYILFPDPWPKTRHNKRRLITPRFARLLFSKIRAGGFAVAATDHLEYAAEMERSFMSAGFRQDNEESADMRGTTYALKALKKKRSLKIFRFIRP